MKSHNFLLLFLETSFLFFFWQVQCLPSLATVTPGSITARNPGGPPFVWRGEKGKTADGQPGRSPADVQRAGGMWARGFELIDHLTTEQLEAGSSLHTHTGNPVGTRDITQYVSTTTSLPVAITFAIRPSPEHEQEVGYLYRIRTNWAMVDVNLSLEDISPYAFQQEHAAVQGVPWNQVLGWYQVRAADVQRILGAEDPVSQLGPFTRNPDFRPDPTDHSGAQPQLSGVRVPIEGRHGAWEQFVGQSAAGHLRQFIRDHGPQTQPEDQTTLRSLDWSAVRIPDHVRTALGQGAASAAQCALAAAAIIVSWRQDELKRSIPWHDRDGRHAVSNLSDACSRLVLAAKDKSENIKGTVKICDNPQSGGECLTIDTPLKYCVNVPIEWNDKASTVLLSASAGICQFFQHCDCAGDSFQVSFPGNDRLDEFDDGRFNHEISSIRCDNSSPETQIEKPPPIGPLEPDVKDPNACIVKPKPRPLVEILWVTINDIDGEDPGDLYGKITASDDLGSQAIFNVDMAEPVSASPGDQVTLHSCRPLVADRNFLIDMDLWDHDSDWSPNDEVSRGAISWVATNPNNEYDKIVHGEIKGTYGKATVGYVVVGSAVKAEVNVVLIDGDGEDPVDVFGKISVSSLFVHRYLFDMEGSDNIQIRPGNAIPLSRASMAIAMYDSLQISFDLWDHDSLSPDDPIGQGIVEFYPQLSGSNEKLVKGEYGAVRVSVTWGGEEYQGC
ncbi:hypothetical protein QQS21_010604 [Conoideocrella luteorostrata]|uniref:DUF6598 domain-containing protein n=1 Tax=Conoideocrella luteorostrata TaxID=1105319 RepID=A0AAJ0CFM2_9HYPO|nr:hypothetical protein QQS21_010604 [Conoideocrella luteorostrata]